MFYFRDADGLVVFTQRGKGREGGRERERERGRQTHTPLHACIVLKN